MFVVFQNSNLTNFVLKYCSYPFIGHSAKKINLLLYYCIYTLQFTIANGEQF